jgi:hypothetical protein
MRFSLKALLALTTLVALGCVGVLYANAMWSAAFTTAAFLAILYGVVAANLKGRSEWAFWVGFAVFGVGYFVLVNYVDRVAYMTASRSMRAIGVAGRSFQVLPEAGQPQLATALLLMWADGYIQPLRENSGQQIVVSARDGTVLRFAPSQGIYAGFNANFVTIGHALFTLLLALVGGLLGQRIVEWDRVFPDEIQANSK